MPVCDFYNFRSGATAVTAVVATPLQSVICGTTIRGWAVACRCLVLATAAATGNELLFQLARPGNTPNGSAGAGGNPEDFSAPASIAQGYTTYSVAPTVGTILAEWTLPQTPGSMTVEYPLPDKEWGIPAIANNAANAGIHLFVTPTVNTGTTISTSLLVSQ